MSFQTPFIAPAGPELRRSQQQQDRRYIVGRAETYDGGVPADSGVVNVVARINKDGNRVVIDVENTTNERVVVHRRVGTVRGVIEVDARSRTSRAYKFGSPDDDLVLSWHDRIATHTIGRLAAGEPFTVEPDFEITFDD